LKTFVVLIIALFIGISGILPLDLAIMGNPSKCNYPPQDYHLRVTNTTNDTLPSARVGLFLESGLLSTGVNATLTFGFSEDDWPLYHNIMIGFRQERILIGNWILSIPVAGIGYVEMREYPFMYFNTGVFFNDWINRTPLLRSYRPYPGWTDRGGMETYTGITPPEASPQNASQILTAGDILEFENLTIYFDDGSSFVCGPQLITVGMNFTQTDTGWTIQRVLNVSDPSGVTIGDDSITISLRGSVPLHPVFLGLIITVPAVVIVGTVWWRRRRLQSEKSETEESDEAMKGAHM
jgi:hypothetical protein